MEMLISNIPLESCVLSMEAPHLATGGPRDRQGVIVLSSIWHHFIHRHHIRRIVVTLILQKPKTGSREFPPDSAFSTSRCFPGSAFLYPPVTVQGIVLSMEHHNE